PKTPKKAKKL
nr:Chain J, CDK2 substrate peptide: PKTPKKAKKL [synthetic construct]3QHR_K Chain K, CDK2 substrate peptide: PKTPKKAKKL [synthetic construct]3QHR_L Chain L, CDK2 substrate peptide: PKTPKKAKKL [synthetic construct]3QHR_M Chain M, CDK2 substrate peptide: PKTPKKAKKL [synthetic construct]3QHW_J Chain J, CDK2 substrate peptide: PKTPKKAKKL [synthetic construct]3QHW_K Chain K, CDK2 substrate peptide: PKTPKKAKKL [synthetic construct]3QHW_L Chain L, CDK2 substrate peptide: PKTPKKAKKL [synthetic constru